MDAEKDTEQHRDDDEESTATPTRSQNNRTMELDSILFPPTNERLPTLLFQEQSESITSDAKQDNDGKEDIRDRRWMTRYEQLVQYKQQHNHFNAPVTDPKGGQAFSDWIRDQRRLAREGKLRADRKQLLDQIGFVYNNPIWMEKYKELLQFKEKHGHCKVPTAYQENRRLASWVRNLRHDQQHGKLRADRKQLLDEIGFVWRKTLEEREHEKRREKIRKAKDSELKPEDLALKRAMMEEEEEKKKQERDSAAAQQRRQDCILHQKWLERYEELKAFHAQNGHFRLTETNGGQALADWMRDQRRRHRDGKLFSERKQLLEEIGFVWSDPIWMDHYQQLLEFKGTHGHCHIPPSHENQTLKSWVKNQRHDQQAGKLKSDRKKMLDDIGFLWTQSLSDAQERKWKEHYRQLIAYKEKYGHCKVTRCGKQQSGKEEILAQWVLNQRRAKRRNRLRSDREKLLEEIGFDFSESNRVPGHPKIQRWMFQYGYIPGLGLMTANNKPYNALMLQARQNLESR